MFCTARLLRNAKISHINNLRTFRYSSSLGSPMFPHKPQIELTPEELSGTKSKTDSDFFTKHGGKVAVIGFSAAAYLIYSFIKGGNLKTQEEEKVSKNTVVEPNEINELRLTNRLTIKEYKNVMSALYKQSKEQFNDDLLYYDDFIQTSTKSLNRNFQCGHLLDRIVFSQVQHPTKRSEATVPKLPLHLCQTLLLLTVAEPANERLDALFDIGALIQKRNVRDSEATGSDYLFDRNDDLEISTVDEIISREVVETLLDDLVRTCQIPPDKQVTETGVKYPWRTYRLKKPSEMVDSYVSKIREKSKLETRYFENFTREEFRHLMTSYSVCAWGECYRSK